jgi:hypothetical protein
MLDRLLADSGGVKRTPLRELSEKFLAHHGVIFALRKPPLTKSLEG